MVLQLLMSQVGAGVVTMMMVMAVMMVMLEIKM